MFKKKSFLITILLIVFFLSSMLSLAQETIKIGVVGPRTGAAAATGEAFEEGIELFLDYINDTSGGILGKKVEVIFEDTAGVPEKATSAFEKLASKDEVSVVAGESHSSCALAEIELANRYEVPFIISEAWADDITSKGYKWVFRAGPCNSGVVENIINWVVAEEFKKVMIVAENTDWGLGIKNLSEAALQEKGITYDSIITSVETQEYYTELNRIKDYAPDLILAYIYGFGVHDFIAQAYEINIIPNDALLLEGAGPPSLWPQFWENVGDAGELECFVSAMHTEVELTEMATKFREAYVKKFNKEPTDYKSRSIYNSLLIAADAMKRAGSTNNDEIVKALETTNLEVAAGIAEFGTEPGTFRYHQWQPPMLIIQWQNHEQVVVFPEEAATGELKRGE